MSAALSADHLNDLRKSGLTDETIARCQFESVRPHDIKLKGVDSAYRLPYFDLAGKKNYLERIKLFPPIKRDNSTQKYHQASNTSPALYLPPLLDWGPIARANSPLLITEGEKKAAALTQHRIPCLGVAGVWNWRKELESGAKMVLPALEQFVWAGRPVELIPDSDVWRDDKKQALCGFYALAQELVSRGASVQFVILPEGGQGKAGIDDWIVSAQGGWQHQWELVTRIALDDERLSDAVAWWQEWRAKQVEQKALAEPDEPMTVEDVVGTYIVTFPRTSTTFEFANVESTARGVQAEVTAAVHGRTILGETDLNLKSDNGRTNLTRTLQKSAQEIPWRRYLERSCAEVLRLSRMGEQVTTLRGESSLHTQFILNPLIYKGHQTVVFAPGGSLKSYLALYFSMLLARGATENGVSAIRTNVLYLDWELDYATIDGRAKLIWNGHPQLNLATPYYRRCYAPLHTDLRAIGRLIHQHQIGCLIIDSAALACGGSLQSEEAPIRLQQSLKKLGCGALVLAHVAKGNVEGQDRSTYGSVFFREMARNVIELSRLEESDRVVFSQASTACKNSFGPKIQPLGFEVSMLGDMTVIDAFNPSTEPESGYEDKLPACERVSILLRDGKVRTSLAIAEDLKMKLPTIMSTMSRYNSIRWKNVGPKNEAKWTAL